ncbi:putative lipid II flippase FtsW [Desulfosporosinus sp. BICA1-9]|uniref:putative lipid II flippase FtsW n=1 Tax=Desulfosporosinus sp. BICA1-9 TaxID=1531958 RepID=UPI00054C3BC8|nr:putative lipid II flippase FtsW [Desulfosporosinus sp. BICA1-9]KJS48265.1 MAG: cell division protein FtsW [Peptococcaceae bacterium BRH_c23]KJS88862.1 MAG: cell division protein FtsW [Desulfosporosinus sp. BICA1-9]KJS89353.1 MAG: cell division protein FtsW [Desulfosporosinus sp. BICA1-9]HBW37290.1 putative lipid II flippase FtsW [Desulfosporosinus sp.]
MAKRKLDLPIDFPILFLTLALLAFGLIMILSAGAVRGFNATDNSYFYVTQQLKWAIVGSFFALVAMIIPYTFLRRLAGLGVIISMILLIAIIFTDAGIEAGGSARWIKILGFTVQPSEVAKLALVLFYAHILDRYPIKQGKDWRIPLGILIPITLLVLALVYKQPDLGTAMVLALTCTVMLLQTELPTFWFVAAVPTLGVPLLYLIYNTEYQWNRILVWLDPWKDAMHLGYQITNAEIAFGSGGLFGVGLGRSLQKYGFLPENHTDMIFAIVGEELGLIGTVFLLFLFIALYARAYHVISGCPDRFGRLLGFGLISTLAIQTTVNLSVVTGVLPVTGITLPLISYGGNSLVITLAKLGLILNITRYKKIPKLRMVKSPPKHRGVNSF